LKKLSSVDKMANRLYYGRTARGEETIAIFRFGVTEDVFSHQQFGGSDNFQIISEISLSPQAFNPIALRCTNGLVLLEMQDRAWISEIHYYPPGNVGNIRDLATVQVDPQSLRPNVLASILARQVGQPFATILGQFQNQISVYYNIEDGEFDYLMSDHQYHFANNGELAVNDEEAFPHVLIPVQQEAGTSIYGVGFESSFVVAGFDRFGNILWQVHSQPVDHPHVFGFTQITIPPSLRADQPFPGFPENRIVQDRLFQMSERHADWGSYSNDTDAYVYVLRPTVVFNPANPFWVYSEAVSGEPFVNLENRVIVQEIPPGELRRLSFDPAIFRNGRDVIVVIMDNGSVSLWAPGPVLLSSTGEVSLSPRIQQVYSVRGIETPLLQELRERQVAGRGDFITDRRVGSPGISPPGSPPEFFSAQNSPSYISTKISSPSCSTRSVGHTSGSFPRTS
jgi:hypothetical protein